MSTTKTDREIRRIFDDIGDGVARVVGIVNKGDHLDREAWIVEYPAEQVTVHVLTYQAPDWGTLMERP